MTAKFAFSGFVAAAVFCLVLSPSEKAFAATTTSCNGNSKHRVKTEAVSPRIQTSSTTLVTITGASMTITVGGTAKSCVVVRFSASGWAGPSNGMIVRPKLDGTNSALPSDFARELVFIADGTALGWDDSNSFAWVFPAVSPGAHTLTMQFRSFSGAAVGISAFTMEAGYR